MSHIVQSHQAKPLARILFFPRWIRSLVAATTGVVCAGVIADVAIADNHGSSPPPPALPQVFCFRITDIKMVEDDPEWDAFEIEFEVLNWSDMEATDVDIALTAESEVDFAGAGVDPNGRPIGPGSAPPPGNLNVPNDWEVDSSSSSDTLIQWDGGTAINPRNLLDALADGGNAAACNLVPGCQLNANGLPIVPNPETVDNGDNVRDGFTFSVDGWDPGEILSFNWFLGNNGSPIGTVDPDDPNAVIGNTFGFGVVSIARLFDDGTAPDPVLPGSAGFTANSTLFYNNVNEVEHDGDRILFGSEFRPSVTSRFQNPANSRNICGSGGCVANVPEPIGVGGAGLASLGMWVCRKYRRRKQSA